MLYTNTGLRSRHGHPGFILDLDFRRMTPFPVIMSYAWCVLVLCVCVIFTAEARPTNVVYQRPHVKHPTTVKYISAGYFREHTHVLSYESTAKIVFNVSLPGVQLPPWLEGNVTGNPVYETIRDQISLYHEDFMMYMQHFEPVSRRKRWVGPVVGAALGYATQSIFSYLFHKSTGTGVEAERYMQELRTWFANTLREQHLFEEKVIQFASEVQDTLERFKDWQIWVTQNDLALQHLSAVEHLYNHLRVGLERCVHHLFPIQVVSTSVFHTALKQLQNRIRPSGYDLALDADLLRRYEKLRIADCFTTPSNVLVVVNVPIRKTEWRVFEFIPIPFRFHNKSCSLVHTDNEVVAMSKGFVKIVDKVSLPQCNILNDFVCFVPEFSRPSDHNSQCISALYYGSSHDELGSLCQFKCSDRKFLSIIQVEVDKIIASNADYIQVTCRDLSYNFESGSYGAIEIVLKCNCTYNVSGNVFTPSGLCQTTKVDIHDVNIVYPNFWERNGSAHFVWPTNLHVLEFNRTTVDVPLPHFTADKSTHFIWLVLISILLVGILAYIGAVCVFWCRFR